METPLRRMQEALIAGLSPERQPERVGAFLVLFHPSDPMLWLNQAVPVEEPTEEDVHRLLDAYAQRGRTPFLEFFADLWPSVGATLEAAGFACLGEQPLLVATGGEEIASSESPGVVVRAPRAEELGSWRGIAGAAFADSDEWRPASPEVTAGSLKSITDGHLLAAVADRDGHLVGVGSAIGTREIREIAGIGVLPKDRRQGVAAAIVASLATAHFGGGGTVAWLTAGSDAAASVYRRVGFRPAGRQLTYGWGIETVL